MSNRCFRWELTKTKQSWISYYCTSLSCQWLRPFYDILSGYDHWRGLTLPAFLPCLFDRSQEGWKNSLILSVLHMHPTDERENMIADER